MIFTLKNKRKTKYFKIKEEKKRDKITMSKWLTANWQFSKQTDDTYKGKTEEKTTYEQKGLGKKLYIKLTK